MLNQLRCLIEYQTVEDKKNQLIRSSQETPRRIAELEREFELFEGEYLSKKAEQDNAQKMRKTLEQTVSDLEGRMQRQKARTGEIKTNKEYQAALKEIDETQKEVSRNEDSMLEVMERIEVLGREVKDLEQEVAGRRKKMEEDVAVLQRESEQLRSRLDRLEKVRKKVRERIDADLLKRTDFLFEKQAGIAVAAVENGVCQVCHLNIPPQKFIELQRDEAILQCPHCHRFLYWPGHEGYCILGGEIEDI